MSCNPHRDVREHIPHFHSSAVRNPGHCCNTPHLTSHPPNILCDLSSWLPEAAVLQGGGKRHWRFGAGGCIRFCQIQTSICPSREINNLLCGNCQSSMTSYFNLNIVWCHFVTLQKRLDKTFSGSQLITFWQVTCVCTCVCWSKGGVCVKEVASKRGWKQGCSLSGGKLSKNSSGENTHMPLCVLAVLWPDFSTVLHERDWCTSQRGQCAVWLSVSERLASAQQLPQCVCVHMSNTQYSRSGRQPTNMHLPNADYLTYQS